MVCSSVFCVPNFKRHRITAEEEHCAALEREAGLSPPERRGMSRTRIVTARLLFESDSLFDELMRLADVLDSAVLGWRRVVFLLNVVVGFVEQIGRFIEARDPAEVRIERI